MLQKTIAEIVVETLIAAGVKRVYGVVGDSLNAIVNRSAATMRSSGFTYATKRRLPLPPVHKPISPVNWRSALEVAAQAMSIW